MSTFLDVAVAAPHVVDIGGFVCINRSWLTNVHVIQLGDYISKKNNKIWLQMLGNLLSSLIILLQFRVQQSDDQAAANAMNSTNQTIVTT